MQNRRIASTARRAGLKNGGENGCTRASRWLCPLWAAARRKPVLQCLPAQGLFGFEGFSVFWRIGAKDVIPQRARYAKARVGKAVVAHVVAAELFVPFPVSVNRMYAPVNRVVAEITERRARIQGQPNPAAAKKQAEKQPVEQGD